MFGFKALNIESDDESDVEVDDTKELQIEDALKLYQTALKYHAEGPASFNKAAEAYEQLFQSDIFKYPESQTELDRIELYGPAPETDNIWSNELPGVAVVPAGGLETGPSTLPQILHLSHKNYAQFKLEYLSARFETLNVTLNQILHDATAALDHFVGALDKDDSDLDLWRKAANVGEMLESKRIARFCLEAVLDGDDESLGSVLSLPGLEEGLAGEQLRLLIRRLEDQLSWLQSPLSVSKRKLLSKMLKMRLSPYQEITERQGELRRLQDSTKLATPQLTRVLINEPRTWAEVGDLLLRQFMNEQHGKSTTDSSVAVCFEISSAPHPVLKTIEATPFITQSEARSVLDQDTETSGKAIEQRPGLDDGNLAVQQHIAPVDADMQATVQSPADEDVAMTGESSKMVLPTRKRSGDEAGLQDGTEEGRSKSKRTRTRDSAITEDSKQAIIDANTLWEYEQQLNEFQAADDWMFETVGNLFERIGIVGFEAARNVRQELQGPSSEDSVMEDDAGDNKRVLKQARSDIHTFLSNYNDPQAGLLMSQGETSDGGQSQSITSFGGSTSGNGSSRAFVKPPVIPNTGLIEFLAGVNDEWFLTSQVAWKWVEKLLRPNSLNHEKNSYRQYQWPEDLKTMVVRTLVNFDEIFNQQTRRSLEDWKEKFDTPDLHWLYCDLDADAEVIEAIFELHLDIYCLIKQSNSGVDAETVVAQSDRLQRWSEHAREIMHFRSVASEESSLKNELNLRFLWATTLHIGAAPDTTQAHVIECMNDLRAILVEADESPIQLQNNAIMPDLSIAALDREISRLTTKDFFVKVMSQDMTDPVAIIESLEPLLESLDVAREQPEDNLDAEEGSAPSAVSPELVSFVQSSDLSVRLLLWQRLRDAYIAIEYKPMVASCYLRMIRLVLSEMKLAIPSDMSQSDRQAIILKAINLIREMTAKVLTLVRSTDNAFECIDEEGLKSTIITFGEVLQLIQVFNVFEDSVRVGKSQAPTLPAGLPVPSFAIICASLHDMQLHIWMIIYLLLKEAIFQFHKLFPTPAEDKFDFLRVVHRALGLRGICGGSNRAFVRMLKDEFFQMTHVDGYDSEQSQVLYDLYGLNCFLNPNYELIEHKCTHDAFLDRSVALQAVDLLLQQASKLPMKDLVKHPLKDTIDKVHGAATRKKTTDAKQTEAVLRNRETYRSFVRSPINPLDLFNCLKGEGNQLTISVVPKNDALLASKGWYFLMGHIALSKFRSQKRTAPAPTEDVDIATAFFMQDLEYSMDNWETWFRLGQAYDTKVEESVVWSAEKLNNVMHEVIQLQRSAIHCYTMATALANRSADFEFETSAKITELYSDFALRLYSSSREPFGMQPFAIDDSDKFVSMPSGIGKGPPFQPLRTFTAWKLAKVLFQRALAGKSQSWTLHYMLGKCLWKMHATRDHLWHHDVRPTAQQVLDSFIKAIDLIPDKKDSREKREPVLEPHYKLVSTVNKMISRGDLTLEQAKEALDHTPYARNVAFPTESDQWVTYILAVLKNLRTADKSNWHHRMVVRAAQIIYDGSNAHADATESGQDLGAKGAKHELTLQMFTKTMVLQVWRPESERAGRHFVYTTRYTRFFVRILEQLKDRSNLEMLARRIRRRPYDLYEHNLVWEDICNAYLRLLRSHAALPDGLETAVFSNIAHEDFLMRKEPLEKWMQAQDMGANSTLDVLREVQELKKINQSLKKPGPIDDLIGDSYAQLFNTVGKQVWDEEQRVKAEEEAKRAPPAVNMPRNPMMSLNHLMNTDGAEGPSGRQPVPAASVPVPQPEPVPTRRKMGVGRREIRTCAEACFQKASVNTAPLVTKPSSAYPRVRVVIDASKPDTGGYTSVDTSAPGSIHDSADDESELSELEEEAGGEEEDGDGRGTVKAGESRRPVFPGLATQDASRATSEGFETAEEEPQGGSSDVDMQGTEQKASADSTEKAENSDERTREAQDESEAKSRNADSTSIK